MKALSIPRGAPDRNPGAAVRDLRPLATLLVALTLLLMAAGLGMLSSASTAISVRVFKDQGYGFLIKQVIFTVPALIALWICSRMDYRRWRRLLWAMAPVSLGLLVLVLFMPEVNGSRRWIPLPKFQVQPSELAKVTMAVLMAAYITHFRRRMQELWKGLLFPMAGLGAFCVLVLLEPDYGTTLLLAVTGVAMLFLGGVRLGPLAVVSLAGAQAFLLLVLQDPVRTRRIIAFLHPERYSDQEAFQQIAAEHAFMLGGATGAGFGQGLQKLHYLPEAHTDFIFAIIGEELGITATLAVLAVFLVIFVLGLRIAAGAGDYFGRMLAYGITLVITLQAMINMAVVTGLMPNKGLPLPFISYGGSSLIVSAAMIGILVNIARVSSDERMRMEKNPVKDRVRWIE